MRKTLTTLYWLSFGFGASLVASGILLMIDPSRVHAVPPVLGNLISGKTLGTLGSFEKDGSFNLPAQAADYLGGRTSITWKKGQNPIDVMPLAMWDTAFKTGALTPAQINPSLNMDNMQLGKYLSGVSIGELVDALPNLANAQISDIAPIRDLSNRLISQGSSLPSFSSGDSEVFASTIGDLAQNPEWSKQTLGDVSGYSGKELPGVSNTPLNSFPSVRGQPAANIPGLSSVKIEDMPGFNLPAGYAIVKPDAIRTKEPTTRKVLSGSKEEPNAECKEATCNHLEVRGIINGTPIDGGQIVDGDTQEVRGGYGVLGSINGGREATGFLPYGDRIKEVYHGFDAKTGTVSRSWYFDYCQKLYFPFGVVVDLGCTPHFIGPIGIGSLKEGDSTPLLLGNIQIPIKISGAKIKKTLTNTVQSVITPGGGQSQQPVAQTQIYPAPKLSPAQLSSSIAETYLLANVGQIQSIASSNTPIATKMAQIVGGVNSALPADTPSLVLGGAVGNITQSLVQKYGQ